MSINKRYRTLILGELLEAHPIDELIPLKGD